MSRPGIEGKVALVTGAARRRGIGLRHITGEALNVSGGQTMV